MKQLPSGAWHAQVYNDTDAAGKRHYKSFTSYDKRILQKEPAAFKANKMEERIDRSVGRVNMTIGEAIDAYIASP